MLTELGGLIFAVQALGGKNQARPACRRIKIWAKIFKKKTFQATLMVEHIKPIVFSDCFSYGCCLNENKEQTLSHKETILEIINQVYLRSIPGALKPPGLFQKMLVDYKL